MGDGDRGVKVILAVTLVAAGFLLLAGVTAVALFAFPPRGPLYEPLIHLRRALRVEDPLELQEAQRRYEEHEVRAHELVSDDLREPALAALDAEIREAELLVPRRWYLAWAFLDRGRAHLDFGDYAKAMADLRESDRLMREEEGEDSSYRSAALVTLAMAAWRADAGTARKPYDEARRLALIEPWTASPNERAFQTSQLSFLARRLVLCEDAVRFGEEALEALDQVEEPLPSARQIVLTDLGWAEYDLGRMQAAQARFEELAALYDEFPEQASAESTVEALIALAQLAERRGRVRDEADYVHEALDLARGALPPDNSARQRTELELADLQLEAGDTRAAEAVSEELLQGDLRPWLKGVCLGTLTEVRSRQGRLADAVRLAQESRKVAQGYLGEVHVAVAGRLDLESSLEVTRERPERALELHRQAEEMFARFPGATDRQRIWVEQQAAEVLIALDRPAEAEPRARRALELGLASDLTGGTSLAALERVLGDALRGTGELAEAESLYGSALKHVSESLGRGNVRAAPSLRGLGLVRLEQGRKPEARALLREALQLRRKWLGQPHPDVVQSLEDLARVAASPAEAASLSREAQSLRRQGQRVWY